MRKKLAWFAQNADTVMPLLLGTAVSILALAGAASQEVVDGSMLACLAVLAFALIRDRLSDEAAARPDPLLDSPPGPVLHVRTG